MANSKIFEKSTTVKAINGLELDIAGEIYEKPLYPGSEANARILVIDNVGNQTIGTIVLPGTTDRQRLETYMVDVIANPLNYIDQSL